MARLHKQSFRHGKHEYELDLSWNDAAFAENDLAFEVSVTRRTDGVPTVQKISASVSVRPDANNEPVLYLKVGTLEVDFPLRELFEESQIIDKIPAALYGLGDPLTGCLVRSGLSAVIGQIINCKNQTSGIDWYWDRLHAIGRCMKAQIPSMGAATVLRAAKCVASAGI
jgi:hypothetical protein